MIHITLNQQVICVKTVLQLDAFCNLSTSYRPLLCAVKVLETQLKQFNLFWKAGPGYSDMLEMRWVNQVKKLNSIWDEAVTWFMMAPETGQDHSVKP